MSEWDGVGSHLIKNWYSSAGICEINKKKIKLQMLKGSPGNADGKLNCRLKLSLRV